MNVNRTVRWGERMNTLKIFVINPGSTSTKLALFENLSCKFSTNIFHDSSVLMKFPTINDQLYYRMSLIEDFLTNNHIDLSNVDAIVGRGGSSYSVKSGVYTIDSLLIQDTKESKGGLYHPSMLGVQLAQLVQEKYGGKMFMIDPPVVDEYCDLARVTGISGVYRKAVSHALNLKACARYHCKKYNKKYENSNFIICHIDGGISITAHLHGQMIDGNDAGGGQGPFTPTRMGDLAITDAKRVLHDKTEEYITLLCSEAGGLSSHFHTSNADTIHEAVEAGNTKATRVWKAMVYQIAKYIGAMSTVLKGDVDGILLTGGLLRFDDIIDQIKESCEWIAPVYVYPGEFEQEAMAEAAYNVLTNKVEPLTYTGKPVWDGFSDENSYLEK